MFSKTFVHVSGSSVRAFILVLFRFLDLNFNCRMCSDGIKKLVYNLKSWFTAVTKKSCPWMMPLVFTLEPKKVSSSLRNNGIIHGHVVFAGCTKCEWK